MPAQPTNNGIAHQPSVEAEFVKPRIVKGFEFNYLLLMSSVELFSDLSFLLSSQ
jgi:hypothetical protein